MPAPVPPRAVVVLPPRDRARTLLLSLGVLVVTAAAGLVGALLVLLVRLVSDSWGVTALVIALLLVGAVAVGIAVTGLVLLVRRLFPAGARADTTVLLLAAGAGASLVALTARAVGLPAGVSVPLLALPVLLMTAVLWARDAGLRRDAAGAAGTGRVPGRRR
jgi:hypothetical protein